MDKLFLDANIWFSAARSPEGGSGYIIRLAKKDKIKLSITSQIIAEVEKNLRKKENNAVLLQHFENFFTTNPKLVLISKKDTIKYSDIINSKDALIIAGAIKSKSNYLVTLDKKHFFTSDIANAKLPITIVMPEMYLQKFINQ